MQHRAPYASQESLGGNCKTTMVACISAADADLKEALSTLRFAARAKRVRVHARVNAAVEVTIDRRHCARPYCLYLCMPLRPSVHSPVRPTTSPAFHPSARPPVLFR